MAFGEVSAALQYHSRGMRTGNARIDSALMSESLPAPAGLLANGEFVMATIRGEHPDHPGWRQPVEVVFRRSATGWDTVGISRQP